MTKIIDGALLHHRDSLVEAISRSQDVCHTASDGLDASGCSCAMPSQVYCRCSVANEATVRVFLEVSFIVLVEDFSRDSYSWPKERRSEVEERGGYASNRVPSITSPATVAGDPCTPDVGSARKLCKLVALHLREHASDQVLRPR